jgi:hypothetical protein
MGDFNVPNYMFENSQDKFALLIRDYQQLFGFSQYNNIYNSYDRILDLVLSTKGCEVLRDNVPIVEEDAHHPALIVELSYNRNNLKKIAGHTDYIRYNFKKANYPLLYSLISTADWSYLNSFTDVNLACEAFYQHLYSIFDLTVSLTKSRLPRYQYLPWFNREIINNIRRKDSARKKFKKYGSELHHNDFCNLRLLVKYQIGLAFKQYVRHIESDIKTDPKKLWSYIQVKNKTTRIPNVLYDIVGHEFDDPPSVVNAFCSYFSSVYIKSDSSNTLEVDLANFNNLHIPLFTKDDIAMAIKKLKDKPTAGTDQVPSFVVKDCGSAFTEPLFIMFNLILKCSVFPERWKESRICPVLKKGDPSLMNNYRPISILSNLSKVFEMILYKYIYDFAKQRIDTTQHGFMRGRSTITNLACFSQFLMLIIIAKLM